MTKLNKKGRVELRSRFGGRCAYCGCELPENGWHVDHVAPVNRELKYVRDKKGRTLMVPTGKLYNPENDRADNLMPACRACNIDKSVLSLEAWRDRLTGLADNLRRNSSAFRHAERFRRVQIVDESVVFWFESRASGTGDNL